MCGHGPGAAQRAHGSPAPLPVARLLPLPASRLLPLPAAQLLLLPTSQLLPLPAARLLAAPREQAAAELFRCELRGQRSCCPALCWASPVRSTPRGAPGPARVRQSWRKRSPFRFPSAREEAGAAAAMQVSSLNEVKIYSLSAGRSLPEVRVAGGTRPARPGPAAGAGAGPGPARG